MSQESFEHAEKLREQGIEKANKGDIAGAISLFNEGITSAPYDDKLYYFRALTRLLNFNSHNAYLVSDATYSMDDFFVYTLLQWMGYLQGANNESADEFYKFIRYYLISVSECFRIVNPESLVENEPDFDELMRRDLLVKRGIHIAVDEQEIKKLDVENIDGLLNYMVKIVTKDFDDYLNSGIREDVRYFYVTINKSRELFLDFLNFFVPRYKASQRMGQRVSNQPSEVKAIMKNGDKYYQNEDFKNALDIYQKVLAYDSKNEEALVKQGLCFYILNQIIDARNSFEAALKVNPNNAVVQGYLKLCY